MDVEPSVTKQYKLVTVKQGAVVLCGWEGNRRSGVALAKRHRLQWFIQLRAHGLDREMSTPPMLSCGVWPIYLYLYNLHKVSGHMTSAASVLGCDLRKDRSITAQEPEISLHVR